MPSIKTKPKVDRDALYVAWDAAIVGDRVVQAGKRLRGDHPAVQHAPWLFLRADTPDDEIARHREQDYVKEFAKVASLANATNPERDVRILEPPKPVPDEDAVVAIRLTGPSGHLSTVDVGDKLRRDDAVVKRDPGAFVEVTNGLPRERAVVALQPSAMTTARATCARSTRASGPIWTTRRSKPTRTCSNGWASDDRNGNRNGWAPPWSRRPRGPARHRDGHAARTRDGRR